MEAAEKACRDNGLDGGKLLLVATPKAGPAALAIINRNHARLAGAVLISVRPLEISLEASLEQFDVGQWSPRGDAWKLPIWVTVGTNVKDAAKTLLLWRQVAAVAPAESCMTIDTRMGEGEGLNVPGKAIGGWLDDIAAGKQPVPGPDEQVARERMVFESRAKELVNILANVEPSPAAAEQIKRQGSMEVSVVPPDGWKRDARGELNYHEEASPYVQIYLTPLEEGPLFARIVGVESDGNADDVLDGYMRRLAEKGHLIVNYHRRTSGPVAYQVCSILWPGREKWHRWLMVAAAKGGSRQSPAAPLVLVMDSSGKADLNNMAPAAKQLVRSARVLWLGRPSERKAKDKSPDARQPAPTR
jgi:hypothetical protein